ncbi:21358_t:CDS:2, partial [Cetraspora pellucida]
MSNPSIVIDPLESQKFDISIDLQKIYYHPSGYQRTSKKLYDVSHNARFDFTLVEVQRWLEKQLLHLIHKARPKYIPCISFNKITIPMEVIQADLRYMPHDKIRNKIYKYALTCVDIASRTKWTLQTDFGSEFYRKCEELMVKYNVKINRSKSKKRQDIVERFNRTLQKWTFFIQDAVELLLYPTEHSQKLKHVYAKSSKLKYGPMGYNEIHLTYSDSVLYLLNSDELEGRRRCLEDIDGNGP